MDNAVITMLNRYHCQSLDDYTNALKEIIQEIALLGVWRAKFFDKAAFYGGTALRILYGLNRFSEDLDFSLLTEDPNFDISTYNTAVQKELEAFRFELNFISKPKIETQVVSAFIRATTKIQLLNLKVPQDFTRYLPKDQQIKIKMEIDIDPPSAFKTQAKTLLQPIPFTVNAYGLEDIFAGKIHALLFRKWHLRVKGRDWYDFVWLMGQDIPVRIQHLEARIRQSNPEWDQQKLTLKEVKSLIKKRISDIDIDKAKEDVYPFLKDPDCILLWSKAFFNDLVENLKGV